MVISWDRMLRVAGQPRSVLVALPVQLQAAADHFVGLFFGECRVCVKLLWCVFIFSVETRSKVEFYLHGTCDTPVTWRGSSWSCIVQYYTGRVTVL